MPRAADAPTVRRVSSRPPDARTDAALLAAHVGGDRRAFDVLFARHRSRLYRAARVRGASAEDADDAVQEAMAAAHRAAGDFRNDGAVSGWLYRMVLNACVSRLRYNRIRPTGELLDDGLAVVDPIGRLETALVVRQALLRLPVDQRAAVLAVDLQGYDVATAAALLGVAEGTVKSRRARARLQLAALLRGQAAD